MYLTSQKLFFLQLQELGIHSSVAALNDTIQVARPTPQPRKRKQKIDREEVRSL
jgi:hypothetical protein